MQPKRVICPQEYLENGFISIKDSHITVLETIHQGQVLTLTESQIGKLNYLGQCPVNLANLIKQKNKISRINGLEVEFKD